jgi:IS1 family transposase
MTPKIAEERIAGDVWAWVAIDADTKLIPTWRLGKRDSETATEFIQDLAGRLANRVQLTTDGLKVYINAVLDAFGTEVDYSVIHKIYGTTQANEARYSPAACIGCEKKSIIGKPDPDHISTSYIERQNLTMRMSMRRFTRLTNGFSKKIENHSASVALYMMYYNFGRKHMTLKTSPAVAAGLTDHIWSVEEIVAVLEAREPKSTRPAKTAVSN